MRDGTDATTGPGDEPSHGSDPADGTDPRPGQPGTRPGEADPTPTVDDQLLGYLDSADLPKEAEELVFAAMCGEDELRAVLGGGRAPARAPAGATGTTGPTRAYLTAIEVHGFRGVGETATVDLVPGPGLTVITGRNGSGKSSFAEAAELALTGDNQRWANRTQVWREGWRNLHVTGQRYVRIGLGLTGRSGGAVVECRWPEGAELDDRETFYQPAGERRRPVSELGWERPLELYRPFLSYSELGGLLNGRPSEMYDSLYNVLGLDRLREIEDRLKEARRDTDRTRRLAREQRRELDGALAAHPAPHARQAEELLADFSVDLDRLEALAVADDAGGAGDVADLRALDGLELPERGPVAEQAERLTGARHRLRELAGTPAAEARLVAGLLQTALQYHRHHPGQPCPVCQGRVLDTGWARTAESQVERLTTRAEGWEQAEAAAHESRRRLRELVPAAAPVLRPDRDFDPVVDLSDLRAAWRAWDDLLGSDDPDLTAREALSTYDTLADALAPVRQAARRELVGRQQAWRPVAERIRQWVELERQARIADRMHRAAQRAVNWLRGVNDEIRNRRLAPLADRAAEIWTTLRQDSNVDLGAVRLTGTGPQRRVDLDVAVDGEQGAALGVMSQGELHALALSLFLPRATVPASPFRFLVIDDPVQSMDPAKVYGLAEVLSQVAADRQVVVFTHDDRLPSAVRRLNLKAHLLVVSRREHSAVTVRLAGADGDPARRYLSDAHAVASDPAVDPDTCTRVVCALLRDAVEARCHDLVFGRGVRAGRTIADLEADLENAKGLREVLALELFDDPKRTGDVDDRLRRLHPRAPQILRDLNNGSHGGRRTVSPAALVDETRDLVERLSRR